jgi:hypothetical protein
LETLESLNEDELGSNIPQADTRSHHIDTENPRVGADNEQVETELDRAMRKELDYFMSL